MSATDSSCHCSLLFNDQTYNVSFVIEMAYLGCYILFISTIKSHLGCLGLSDDNRVIYFHCDTGPWYVMCNAGKDGVFQSIVTSNRVFMTDLTSNISQQYKLNNIPLSQLRVGHEGNYSYERHNPWHLMPAHPTTSRQGSWAELCSTSMVIKLISTYCVSSAWPRKIFIRYFILGVPKSPSWGTILTLQICICWVGCFTVTSI